MEIAIGVQFTARELRLEVDEKIEGLRKRIDESTRKGEGVIWFEDRRGRFVGVPVDKLAYVEFDTTKTDRQVGFSVGEQVD